MSYTYRLIALCSNGETLMVTRFDQDTVLRTIDFNRAAHNGYNFDSIQYSYNGGKWRSVTEKDLRDHHIDVIREADDANDGARPLVGCVIVLCVLGALTLAWIATS